MSIKNELVENKEKLRRTRTKSEIFLNKVTKSNDPLKHLGVGISSFHQLLIMLFALFFILALLHIPVL
jgi:hypothetical protein